MHQHPIVGYIIGMIIRNLEVIDLDRAFEQLMLDLFHDDILTVDKDENVTARRCAASVQPLTGQ